MAVDTIDWISQTDRALLVNIRPDVGRQEPANIDKSDGQDKPNTEREVQICKAFARAFGVDTFPVRANFFEQGGYSLLAAQLISGLAKELGVKIPLRALFDHPTPRALARYLSAPGKGAIEKPDLPLLVLCPGGGLLMREMIDLRNALQTDF